MRQHDARVLSRLGGGPVVADRAATAAELPPHQQAIRARCLHPTGVFVPFEMAAVEQSLTARFEQQVERHRDRVAVQVGARAWTYEALNRAANAIARAILARQGQGSEPVGLLFDTGINAIAALLGTLKAGKIYVPLDAGFPPERVASILQDAGARLVVTDVHNRPPDVAGLDLLVIDAAAADAEGADENSAPLASPADIACLIYTSGSTGRPKGVMQSHRSLLHWAMVHTNDLQITPDDRLTMLHSWSVPSCLHHLLSSLLSGAALLPHDPRVGGSALVRWLREERLTIYHSIPAVFRQLVAALNGAERFPDMRAIILSGAPMNRDDLDLYRRHFATGPVLLHCMGTTETGWVRRCFIDAATTAEHGVPLGYAIADREVTVLDEHGRTAEGVGEIALQSRYSASGYWRQPELTAAKFVSAPDGGDETIYRTGDLGRMDADGCLFHLGRQDFQVKVRGYRVETAEVERALLGHPCVQEVVAVGRPGAGGDARLVAYFVPTAGQVINVTGLRRHLEDKLPDYMIPSAFVRLDALPTTPNGKLDYAGLPDPDDARPELATAYAAPGTALERAVALAWQEVLGLGKVGVHDNFFDLGGNSLLLARLHQRLQADLQKEFPMVDMFQHPTVDALVRHLVPAREAASTGDGARIDALRAGRHRLARLAEQRQRAREVE